MALTRAVTELQRLCGIVSAKKETPDDMAAIERVRHEVQQLQARTQAALATALSFIEDPDNGTWGAEGSEGGAEMDEGPGEAGGVPLRSQASARVTHKLRLQMDVVRLMRFELVEALASLEGSHAAPAAPPLEWAEHEHEDHPAATVGLWDDLLRARIHAAAMAQAGLPDASKAHTEAFRARARRVHERADRLRRRSLLLNQEKE